MSNLPILNNLTMDFSRHENLAKEFLTARYIFGGKNWLYIIKILLKFAFDCKTR